MLALAGEVEGGDAAQERARGLDGGRGWRWRRLWWRVASVGDMGDSATSCMSDVDGAEVPVDGVIAVGGVY